MVWLYSCEGENFVSLNKYAEKENWHTLPESASNHVDVFFLYPTTYLPDPESNGPEYSSGWNQTLEQGRADPAIDAHVISKASVFYKAGTNLYVPFYQQAAGRNVLEALIWKKKPENSDAAKKALEKAYKDVSDAFDYYIENLNKQENGESRPFILAGHSQGANMILLLLERKFSDEKLRKQLVAAYVIGWSVTAEDMEDFPALVEIGICSDSTQTGCIITYNTQQYPGSFSQNSSFAVGIVKDDAYSVNPLSWVFSSPNEIEHEESDAKENLGALFFKFQPPILPQLGPFTGTEAESLIEPEWESVKVGDTNVLAYKIPEYTGAQSNNGSLVIDPEKLPEPGHHKNLNPPYNTLPGWYHNYDYAFFFYNLEQNAIERIESYMAGR